MSIAAIRGLTSIIIPAGYVAGHITSRFNPCGEPGGFDPEDFPQGFMQMCAMCRLTSVFGQRDRETADRSDRRSRIVSTAASSAVFP